MGVEAVKELQSELQALKNAALEAIAGASTTAELESVRIEYLGRSGSVKGILRGMGQLPPEARPIVGREANHVSEQLENALSQRAAQLKREEQKRRFEEEHIDVTLPGRPVPLGTQHPISLAFEEIREVFLGLGFKVAEGPEVEYDYYNFEALNIPKDHPARAMQDTFFIGNDIVLRTHTSPVQIRYMEKHTPELPVRIIVPGRVYRRDDDATHSPMFHQVEGLLVDRGVTMADLKGTVLEFARQIYGSRTRIRIRPSYFPFTEPSGEADVSCAICGGSGCRTCGYSGWIEILGCGMVHPRVLEYGGYDPEEVSGFAFGMGVERVAMIKYGIDDMREFYVNDLRFLEQFRV